MEFDSNVTFSKLRTFSLTKVARVLPTSNRRKYNKKNGKNAKLFTYWLSKYHVDN